jgi:metal-responsive CopG/Arc/MetJ family transcriptional regulator
MRNPMGRPPLGLELTMVRLPKGMGRRIDALHGKKGGRSAFIRAAIERELQRREAEAAKGKPKRSK